VDETVMDDLSKILLPGCSCEILVPSGFTGQAYIFNSITAVIITLPF
jgi:hypothetical protein